MKYQITLHDAGDSSCTRDLFAGKPKEAESAIEALGLLEAEELRRGQIVDLKSWEAKPYRDLQGGMTSACLTHKNYPDQIIIAHEIDEDKD